MSTSHFRFEICERMTGDDQTIRNAYSCCSCTSYHRLKLWKLSHLGKSIIVFVRKLNFVRWNNVHIFHWQKTSKFPSSKVDTLSSRLQFVDGKQTEKWKSVSNLALVDFFRRKSRSNDLKLLPILLWKWEEKRSDNVFPLPASSFAIQLRTFRKVSLIHHEKQIKVNRKVAPTTQTHEWVRCGGEREEVLVLKTVITLLLGIVLKFGLRTDGDGSVGDDDDEKLFCYMCNYRSR